MVPLYCWSKWACTFARSSPFRDVGTLATGLASSFSKVGAHSIAAPEAAAAANTFLRLILINTPCGRLFILARSAAFKRQLAKVDNMEGKADARVVMLR